MPILLPPVRIPCVALITCVLALSGCADQRRIVAPQDARQAADVDGTLARKWWVGTDRLAAPVSASVGSGDTTHIEVPASQAMTISWLAAFSGGNDIEYRWVLDPKKLSLEFRRPRFGYNWSPWNPALTETRIGPFGGGESHYLSVEARDSAGAVSRLTLRIDVVETTFERELLIVDDTRRFPDQTQGNCAGPPAGPWPSAAELDTFLFARGGNVWKCYPPGTMSEPGLFAGYSFDTLGTRTGNADPTVRLDVLQRYRHVIWIVDASSARMTNPAGGPVDPITALRYMSGPGSQNTLADYIRGGGKVWLLGGGAAQATLLPWNSFNNDGGGVTWSNAQGELVPGRFMYDFVHWRSEIKAVTAPMFINRYLGRNPAWMGAPDYNRLPVSMRLRTQSLDPFPPGRAGQSPSVFYKNTLDAEFLSQQNFIIENGESGLDSLYRVITFSLPPTTAQRVAMTYYHGNENPPVMFSGFDIWSFTRGDCQALVDFVLGDVWGLPKLAPAEMLVNAAPRRE